MKIVSYNKIPVSDLQYCIGTSEVKYAYKSEKPILKFDFLVEMPGEYFES